VDRFIEQRLAREKKRTRRVAKERDDLQAEVETLRGRIDELERHLDL
jgi:hypothetical protein